MKYPTKIQETIVAELERQGRTRYWLSQQMHMKSASQVYAWLKSEFAARNIQAAFDALGLTLTAGAAVQPKEDRAVRSRGAARPRRKRASQ